MNKCAAVGWIKGFYYPPVMRVLKHEIKLCSALYHQPVLIKSKSSSGSLDVLQWTAVTVPSTCTLVLYVDHLVGSDG